MTFTPLRRFRQKISDTPSLSKSPIPTIFQSRFVTAINVFAVDELPEYQMAFEPVRVFLQRMSETWSPLKSPAPMTFQLPSPATVATGLREVATAPSQIVFSPLATLRQRTSDRPSPSKSWLRIVYNTALARNVATVGIVCASVRALSACDEPHTAPPQ